MSDFDPRNLVGWLAVAVCLAFALVLRRTGERGSSARKLALLLVVEAVTLAISGATWMFGREMRDLLSHEGPSPSGGAILLLHHLGDFVMCALYLRFAAAVLHTPLVRPLASRWLFAVVLIIAVSVGLVAVRLRYLSWVAFFYGPIAATFGFVLIASIDAWRRAAPGVQRSRALAFAIGFGFRDLLWFAYYSWVGWTILQGQWDDRTGPSNILLIYPLGSLLSVPLIAYGILKTHIFDIDLRVKWTLQRSTLAAVFVAIVYLVSETADRFFSAELGSVAGLLIAAGVVFFLAPLQRLAERVANAAMPNTQDTPAYAAFKKLQVYEAALAEVVGGGVTDRERAMLARLRETLGIAAADAEAIERDLGTRAGAVTDPIQGSAP